MKIRQTAFMLIAIMAFLVFATACNRKSGGGKRTIAVIPKGVSHFFWQSVHAGAESAAKELDIEITWNGQAQETDYKGQSNIVEDAINSRVDGIVLTPTHYGALSSE